LSSSLSLALAPPPSYPLSLHDALPISPAFKRYSHRFEPIKPAPPVTKNFLIPATLKNRLQYHLSISNYHVTKILLSALFLRIFLDRKSTRLNSSHVSISYAVFCLKKKK